MYDQQIREDVLYLVFYGAAAMLSLVACCYQSRNPKSREEIWDSVFVWSKIIVIVLVGVMPQG